MDCGCIRGTRCAAQAEDQKAPKVFHKRSEFNFAVHAPYDAVFPLLGPHKEQLWADGWMPQFLHPQPANDEAGAVFTISGGHSRVWINPIFDAELGRVKYACFAETMVTLIDIHVVKLDPGTTRATVIYERTALQPEANDYVKRVAENDAAQGPEWEGATLPTFTQRANTLVLGRIGWPILQFAEPLSDSQYSSYIPFAIRMRSLNNHLNLAAGTERNLRPAKGGACGDQTLSAIQPQPVDL